MEELKLQRTDYTEHGPFPAPFRAQLSPQEAWQVMRTSRPRDPAREWSAGRPLCF